MSARGPIHFAIKLPDDAEKRAQAIRAVGEHVGIEADTADGRYDRHTGDALLVAGQWLEAEEWLPNEDNSTSADWVLKILRDTGCSYVWHLDDGEDQFLWRYTPELGARVDYPTDSGFVVTAEALQAAMDDDAVDLQDWLDEQTGKAWTDALLAAGFDASNTVP